MGVAAREPLVRLESAPEPPFERHNQERDRQQQDDRRQQHRGEHEGAGRGGRASGQWARAGGVVAQGERAEELLEELGGRVVAGEKGRHRGTDGGGRAQLRLLQEVRVLGQAEQAVDDVQDPVGGAQLVIGDGAGARVAARARDRDDARRRPSRLPLVGRLQ